ncbi:MAG TPA: MotA/TolQ/ExbB proton channel family protein [Polyangiaceae bacterium]|nr:MotA/TolQ/ExbB proton channel family protein [Polyangiaceae bacterium]
MHIVERTKNLMMNAGSEWIMWLLILLSVASIAVIAERTIILRSLGGDIARLRRALVDALRDGGFSQARATLSAERHPAAKVALRGLEGDESSTSAEQAKEAMSAEVLVQKRSLERRFAFLATLGANAPFIGLFGTVVGILQAFDALGHNASGAVSAMAPQAVMSSISEALVATAIGLAVAIPAVFAFNMFERTVKSAMDDAEILALEIASYLKSELSRRAPLSVRDASPRASSVSGGRLTASLS